MLIRLASVVCGLLFFQHSYAEWQVVTTKLRGERLLLQKEVDTNKGDALVAIMCVPEPTLYVEWLEKQTDISVSIDNVRLDVVKQVIMQNGIQAITLKPGHLQGLINGLNLQLEAALPSGDTITAETSLLGFTQSFAEAKLPCTTRS